MSTLVSVLTPCYEHEQYLSDYFESLLAQSYREIELIFQDDASRDGSWRVAQGYREKLRERFTRVVMRRNDRNLGLLSTLERLAAAVTGDVVCVLESDDYLYPKKIEDNVAYLQRRPEIGLVHSDVDLLTEKDRRVQRARWRSAGRVIPEGDVFEDLLRENFILTCAMACRASLLRAHVDFQTYRDRGYRTADYPMFLDLSRHAPFGYIRESLAVYRVVEGSISHPLQEVDRLRWKLDYYRVKQDYIQAFGCREDVRDRAAKQFHRSLMDLGWVSGSAAQFDRGHRWLSEHDAKSVGDAAAKLRKLAVRHRMLWQLARMLERVRRGRPMR